MVSVLLTWTSFSSYMPAVDGYRYPPVQFQIYRKAASELNYTLLDYSLPGEALSYLDDTLETETIYTYLIVGIDKFQQTRSISIVVDTTSRVPGYSFIEQTLRKLPRWTAAWPQNKTYQTEITTTGTSGLTNYTLVGTVRDNYLNIPLSGATVKAQAAEFVYTNSTSTDAAGGYTLSLPAPTNYHINVHMGHTVSGRTYYDKTIPNVHMGLGNQILDTIGLSSGTTGVSELSPVVAVSGVFTSNYVYESQSYDATELGAPPTPDLNGVVWSNISTGYVLQSATSTAVSGYIPELNEGLIASGYNMATGGFLAFTRTAALSSTTWAPESELNYRLSPTGIALGDAIYTYDTTWIPTTGVVSSIASTSTTGATVNGEALINVGIFDTMVGLQAASGDPTAGATGGCYGFVDMTPSFSPRTTIDQITVGDYRLDWSGLWVPILSAIVADIPVRDTTSAVIHYVYSGIHKYTVIASVSGTVGTPPGTLWNWWEFSTEEAALNYYYSIGDDPTTNPIYGYSHTAYKLFAFGDKGITPITINPDTDGASGAIAINPLSEDTLLRKTLTAECMPLGTAYDKALTMNEDMYINSIHTWHDSLMWQVNFVPKPNQKIEITYNNTTVRQAVDLWDFLNTTDATWYLTSYNGVFDSFNPSKLIYVRNLDIKEISGVISADRTLTVCAATDFYEDSPVWIKIPNELQDRVPSYFKWRRAEFTESINIEASVDLPSFVSVATARYRSVELRDLAIATPYINVSGLSMSMSTVEFKNPADRLAELAGIDRLKHEGNSELISRIINEHQLMDMNSDKSLLFSTANTLGHVTLIWWNTQTSPLLTLEDTIDIFIPGLPEIGYIAEVLSPEASGSSIYTLSSKRSPEVPYNIYDGASTILSTPISGGAIDLGRHYPTDPSISYSFKNYATTVSNGFIESLETVEGNTPEWIYPVLCLKQVTSEVPVDMIVARATAQWRLGSAAWGKNWMDSTKLTYENNEIL